AAGQPAPDPWLAVLREQARRSPDDGAVIYNLAALCDRAGAPDEALAWLRRLDALGWNFPPDDADFPALRAGPEYRALAASFAAREPRARRGRVAFAVGEPDLIPEGIAHDPRAGAFFLSSITKRKIVRVDAAGRASDFVPAGRDGLGATLGLHADPGRRLLWAVSAPPARRELTGERALFGFDLDTGALKHKLAPAPDVAGDRLLNDVAVGPRGELFVTDSNAGALFAAPGPEGPLRPLLPAGTLFGPNGLAYFDEANVLLVAHALGVAVVDPKTGARRELGRGPAPALGGFDGIALRGRTLVGVQNALGAPRVVRAELDAGATAVVSARVLEAASPAFDVPTTGAVAGDAFYVIANSQLRAHGPDGRLRDGVTLRDPRVLALPLGD
ncbi:MAG TPA: hypothetical protein VFS00_03380, partial [Polyangiaceae bacterium]|nr:hypothetical protein [Polyangiaceae bacterium]